MRQNLTGKQKAAMFLISIGPEKSAEIMRHLKDEEIEEVTKAIAGIKKLKNTYQEKVIEEFYQLSLAQEYITEGGINYAKEILEKAFGSSKSEIILKKMTASLRSNGPFEFVKSLDPMKIAQLIKNEHPQTIALILYNIKYQQAATVLSLLPKDKQADVARRVAMMEKPSYDVVKQVEEILQKKISYDYMNDDMSSTISGVETLTEILRASDRGTEQVVMDYLKKENSELEEEIRKKLFTYEDIIKLDDKSIQRVLKDIDNHVLALAIKASQKNIQDLLYKNLSNRVADLIREDIEVMGPVRVRDVEAAQDEIVMKIRDLEKTGEIVINRGGEDEVFV
ncbi:MAG: flagellar motor switch protein FliG [Clostridia bacterium]|nr:flagellar motor switch protein FliG [Clostridia bacterium]